jgi:hypothetical protein
MNLSTDSHEQQTPETLLEKELAQTLDKDLEKDLDKDFDKEELKKEASPAFREFEAKLAQLPTPEEKISLGLAFMTSSISQEGPPRFREFWEARKYTLACFKENINSVIRKRLWDEYDELTKKARVLKQLLEEQSAFAIEHLDDAIKALESDATNFEALLARVGNLEFPEQCPTIQEKSDVYNKIQRELNLLNIFASRMHGLRKEVVKTDMRMRFKTKFFKKMSQVSDLIFPKRKQLIDQISHEFLTDVEGFISSHFQGEEVVGAPYFALREEIKALQGMAKVLTLSSTAFNRTRLKLSECWDKIKVLEKEHKKEIYAKKQVSQENRQTIEKKIEELKGTSLEMPIADLDKAIEVLSVEMRQIELHRADVVFLREQLSGLREPHVAAEKERAKAYEEAAAEAVRVKRENIEEVKNRIALLLKEGTTADVITLEQTLVSLKEEIKQLGSSRTDQQQFDRLLRQVNDLVAEAKEHHLMNLSDDDRSALESLRGLLDQKKKRRKEVKEQIETLRRSRPSSGLDFDKVFQANELLEQEKELLEKLTSGIAEIEEKISELEG